MRDANKLATLERGKHVCEYEGNSYVHHDYAASQKLVTVDHAQAHEKAIGTAEWTPATWQSYLRVLKFNSESCVCPKFCQLGRCLQVEGQRI